MKWLPNDKGQPSFTLTVCSVTLAVVLIKVLLNGVLGQPIDAGLVAALLTPTLGAYTMRRHTEANKPEVKL